MHTVTLEKNTLTTISIRSAVKTLYPGYFALVMATGIVAMACKRLSVPIIDECFFVIALVCYLLLWVMTLARAIGFPKDMAADFRNPARAPGFFTVVAASGVVGTGCLRIVHWPLAAWGLWWMALCLWIALLYAFLSVLITASGKPTVEHALNGSWLILVVGVQSVASLGAMLTEVSNDAGTMMVISATSFMVGCAIYLLLTAVLSLRLILREVTPPELTPPYWVLMGSAAISTLAGAELDRHASAWSLQVNALPVLQGFTLFFWIAATGWIPLLIILGVWRHVVRKHPLTYEPQLWSIVFPLGMYTVASHAISEVFSLSALNVVPKLMLPVAVLAWFATAFGFVYSAFGIGQQGKG